MTERITDAAFTDLDLGDWRVLLGCIEANFECGSYSEADRFAADLAALCDAHDHQASIDLRYPDLAHVKSTTHFMSGLTDRDVTLARAVSGLAAERGYTSSPLDSVGLEIAIDAMDIDAVLPFWQAVLGYVPEKTAEGAQVTAILDAEGNEACICTGQDRS